MVTKAIQDYVAHVYLTGGSSPKGVHAKTMYGAHIRYLFRGDDLRYRVNEEGLAVAKKSLKFQSYEALERALKSRGLLVKDVYGFKNRVVVRDSEDGSYEIGNDGWVSFAALLIKAPPSKIEKTLDESISCREASRQKILNSFMSACY